MRLDAILDPFYVLGSLWAGLAGPQVCSSSSSDWSRAAYTAAGTSRSVVSTGVTAFADVNVVPMDTERVLPNHTVLVENGRITALGPANQVQIPAGAVRIDGRGKYLMPGLGSMHDHDIPFHDPHVTIAADSTVQAAPGVLYALIYTLGQGVTSLGAYGLLNGLPEVPLDQVHKVRSFLKTVPSPRVYFGRKRWGYPRSDSLDAYVQAAKADGYDHVVVEAFFDLSNTSPAQNRAHFDSLVAAARRAGLPPTSHTHRISYDALLTLGPAGGAVDHLYTVTGQGGGV